MSKLHQVLAAYSAKKGPIMATLSETAKVLEKEQNFHGENSRHEHTRESDRASDFEENKKPVTSVKARLKFHMDNLRELVDLQATIDKGNLSAKADLVFRGETIARDVPATTLLFLENQLTGLLVSLAKIPTLDSSRNWVKVEGEEDLYKLADQRVAEHTREETTPLTLAAATDKHPAQAQLVKIPVVFKRSYLTKYSTAITSEEKAQILKKATELRAAVAEARSRANDVEVSNVDVGSILYLLTN